MRAVAAVLGVALLASGCGGTGHSRQARARHGRATSCVDAAGYGGLGSRLAAFDANNNGVAGPAGPTPGAAWYQVIGTDRGCVTAYSVQETPTAALGPHDILLMASRPYLPRDARQIADTTGCAVWSSAALRRGTGRRYARAILLVRAGTSALTAEVAATVDPGCQPAPARRG